MTTLWLVCSVKSTQTFRDLLLHMGKPSKATIAERRESCLLHWRTESLRGQADRPPMSLYIRHLLQSQAEMMTIPPYRTTTCQ